MYMAPLACNHNIKGAEETWSQAFAKKIGSPTDH